MVYIYIIPEASAVKSGLASTTGWPTNKWKSIRCGNSSVETSEKAEPVLPARATRPIIQHIEIVLAI